jgi:hypothetical protein
VIIVEPSDIPETTPLAATEAIKALPLVHVPPPAVSESVIEAPVYTVDAPVIVESTGVVMTLMLLVTVVVPQVLVTA